VRAMGEGWTEALNGVEMPPSPIVVDGERPRARLAPPLLGEHTEAVLAALG
jgi:crotonobetainyl-CoA:carnitine CoA-transferase CaiB-like acyl-CoA transferase